MRTPVLRSCAIKCPDSATGQHALHDKGYSLPHYGHLFVCSCGLWDLGKTDESRVRSRFMRDM